MYSQPYGIPSRGIAIGGKDIDMLSNPPISTYGLNLVRGAAANQKQAHSISGYNYGGNRIAARIGVASDVDVLS